MSNGASDVFWDVLGLAAAAEVSADDPLGWLLARAPSEHHYGFSGFDLDEMPWRDGDIDRQRAALLDAIDRAVLGYEWERLGYAPDRDRAVANLTAFRRLVSAYRLADRQSQGS